MYFLSFETSGKIVSLALSQNEKVLRFRNLKADSLLEDCMLPAMDKILGSAGVKFSQLDGFAIALGPGSFTSLRAGLATVKAFAMSTGKPVVGIPSLDIIAHSILSSPNVRQSFGLARSRRRRTLVGDLFDEICVINDARREKVYACIYSSQGHRKSGYLLASLDGVLDKAHGKTLFVGDALGLYRKDIHQAYRTHASKHHGICKCLFADAKWWYPQAKVMAALAYERFRKKQYDDAVRLLPLYLYPYDCQVTPHGR
jgi:tRNA threonylcarbamoyladenosine biosynthesis protein TsaB